MPPTVTPAPAAVPREETVPYEVEKPARPASVRPPAADVRPTNDATLVGLSAKETPEPVPSVVVADDLHEEEKSKEDAELLPTRRELATAEAKKTVSAVASRLGEGFRMAGQSLADSTAGDFETLLPAEHAAEDALEEPLTAIATRLVRETDFCRRLALRALGRASFADRLGYTAGVIAMTTSIGLAVVAGLGGLFAGGNVIAGRALIVLAGVLAVAVGSGVAYVLTNTVRRTQRDLAERALARAELAETRHHRLSAMLALRELDAKAFRAALERFLGEPPPPPA